MLARSACLAGVGRTEFSSDSGRSTGRLALEATVAAATDAGIDVAEIDGVVPYPMGPSCEDLMGLLGLTGVRFTAVAQMGGASALAGLRLAAMAVEAGAAENVVVFVARNGRSGTGIAQRVKQLAGQEFRLGLEYPHGLSTPAQWYALLCRRYLHEFGLSREVLGTVATTMRAHAQLNPHAQMYGRPLTMADYLAAPMIADPYLKFDCCLETDGAAAVLVTTAERAADAPHPMVRVLAATEGRPAPADDLANREDPFSVGLTSAAPEAYARAGVGPHDVDVAMIYDCFTFEVVQQLEEAGFCERGTAGDFVLGGNIALGGSLPVNPHGGLLSEGHVAGLNHVVEAVTQLRGTAGERQVVGAEIAAVTGWGDLGDGAFALLAGDAR
ncbi:thiolase C-terminal domain-containing protein [Nocardioides pantholopis]|uniref:thiolase C-terminal domain-containing protein n=1 Tax=Nocardioides pantholopis TaxID=2483798 RepID=UPI000F098DF5|nr:transporter [Nocardioides pantholopis]